TSLPQRLFLPGDHGHEILALAHNARQLRRAGGGAQAKLLQGVAGGGKQRPLRRLERVLEGRSAACTTADAMKNASPAATTQMRARRQGALGDFSSTSPNDNPCPPIATQGYAAITPSL
ncbi:hypothetical protein, partial [Mesorhizobium sp.]|uniref:hypothetical protein n=1 Tax=Mesorhizobium sp. TaxID=1871066 RepID=UPI0025EF4EB3